MFVPLTHDGDKGWIFDFVCPGNAMSIPHDKLLLLKNATVNRNLGFDEVCKEKHATIGYNNELPLFGVSETGEMLKYLVVPFVRYGQNVANPWEMQEAFFKYNNIKPRWLNANYNWGILDQTTGQWSGAVGLIQKDEVDYAIRGFSCTYARSKVAAFSMPTHFQTQHLLTRYPQELPPTWNLLGLFTKGYNSQIGNKYKPDLT